MDRPKGYLPTLDGWRALSIIFVLLRHDSVHSFGWISTRWFSLHGKIGVDFFFAISGILISSRLLREEEKTGKIDLTSFYIRRAYRILPATVVFLCVLAVLSWVSLIGLGYREWLGSLFFYRNYTSLLHLTASQPGWYTGNLWSLSVEEHFYLLLPAILVLTRRHYRASILLLISVLLALWCGVQLHHRPWTLIWHHTDACLDSLFVPALLAVIMAKSGMKVKLQRWLRPWPLFFVATLLVVTLLDVSVLQLLVIAILTSCSVLGSVLNPHGYLGRFLEFSPLKYVGRISYSLYIWHQLFVIRHLSDIQQLGEFQRWPLCMIMTFGCAIASYHLVERPMVRLGQRMATAQHSKQIILIPAPEMEKV